jgi:hypothetical protein
MPAFVGLCFCGALFAEVERLPLKQKRCAKTAMGWWGAACVLALACACISPRISFAQTTGTGDKATDTKAAKQQQKTAGKAAKARTSPAKPHAASHPAAGKHPKSNAASAPKRSNPHKSSKKKKTTARGQQKIEPERAEAIQEALIREHYMSGEPAGTWNQASEDAMRRYQADHGWQSKTVPDSRALISLGLGPSHDHLLNPESAMVTGPFPTHSATLTPESHSPDPTAGVKPTKTSPSDPPHAPSPDHNTSGPQ